MNLQGAIRLALRTYNDVRAVSRGRVRQRVGWRIWGKITGRIGGRLFNR